MKKKLMAVVLTAGLVLSMAACGSSSSGSSSASSDSSGSSSSASSASSSGSSASSSASSSSTVAADGETMFGKPLKSADELKIGFLNLSDSDVWCSGARDIFVEYANSLGMEVLTADGEQDPDTQKGQAETFIATEVDAVCVSGCDSEAMVSFLEEFYDAGIPVMAYATVPSEGIGELCSYVGTAHYDGGYMQGEMLAEILPEGGKVCYLQGTPGLGHTQQRHDGFMDGLASTGRDDYEILDDLSGDYYMADAQAIVEDWIQAYPEIDAVIAANDQMALGAINALKAANRLEGTIIMGIDAGSDACRAIEAGEMYMSVDQNAYDQMHTCVDYIVEACCEGVNIYEEYPDTTIELIPVTAENVEEFLN